MTEAYVCLYLDASRLADRQLADSFEAGPLPALVLSDHSRAYQAYRHAGALDKASLTAVLQKYSRAEASSRRLPCRSPRRNPAGPEGTESVLVQARTHTEW